MEEIKPLQVVKRSAAEFTCRVAGSAPLKAVWHKNNEPITASMKHVMRDSNNDLILEIQDCESADEGSYQCVVANEVGSCSGSTELTLKGWFKIKILL